MKMGLSNKIPLRCQLILTDFKRLGRLDDTHGLAFDSTWQHDLHLLLKIEPMF